MAEVTDKTFIPLDVTGTHKRALLTAEASSTETYTFADEDRVQEVLGISAAHVAATGVPLTFAYTDTALTLSTAEVSDADVVVEIIYR